MEAWDEDCAALLVPLATDPLVVRCIGDRKPWSAKRASEVSDAMVEQWRVNGFGWRYCSPLVVYHSAVLAYVDDQERRAFAEAVHELGAVWLSNEGGGVLRCLGMDHGYTRRFLLVRDGHEVLARTDPHGSWVEWAG